MQEEHLQKILEILIEDEFIETVFENMISYCVDNALLIQDEGNNDRLVVSPDITKRPRIVCFVQQTIKSPDGQYIVCMAVEGERGYHRTDWLWGKDFDEAQKLCDQRNQEAGIDPKEAWGIIFGTMRKE